MQRKIFYNGKILTQDISHPYATAFIIEDGKFTVVGQDEPILSLQNENSILINLQQQTVLPGLNDAHIHIWKVGNLRTYMLDLRGVQSLEEMLENIYEYAQRFPDMKWIQARGFNEANFPDQKMPSKKDLDKIISDRPVCVTRTCAHQIIVNSKALELCGITKTAVAPAGGEIKYFPDGELAGHFTETAIGLILSKIPKYTPAELRHMVLEAQEELLANGITSATDPAVENDLLEVYKNMNRSGELKMRINAIPIRVPDGINKIYPNPEFYASPYLNVNTVKFFADGGLSGKTAALKNPYKNENTFGVLRLQKDVFMQLAMESQEAGFKIATHAIGDAAIDMVLDVYEKISSNHNNNLFNRIEHLGLPTAENLLKMRNLQVSAVMQPIFISELGKNFIDYLPEFYLNKLYPLHDVLQAGINLALSTDAPVVKNFSPQANMEAAITRLSNSGEVIAPSQKITMQEAVFAYTMGAAIANGVEEINGSITQGKYADFICISGLETNFQIRSVFIQGADVKPGII